jgi:mRNA-degrading endonuclease toxin of MazEF toxin-antitoxin module
LDQIRTVDKRRLVKRIAVVHGATGARILAGLGEMFVL